MDVHAKANIERFTGYAECYDDFRPQPPVVVVDILTQLAGVEEPGLVVDIGSGTGLSTRIWAGRASQVIGIEPNADMRAQAEHRSAGLPDNVNLRYQEGTSTSTGLPDACADIVTCVQALHWMEPEPTFAEVARILRPEGVFAAIDCDWPPLIHWEVDAAYRTLAERVETLQCKTGVYETVKRWLKKEHLQRILDSGRFRHVREVAVHQVDSGDADRFIGLQLSRGGVRGLMARGLSEEDIGINDLREVAQRVLGKRKVPWYYTYRVRFGVR